MPVHQEPYIPKRKCHKLLTLYSPLCLFIRKKCSHWIAILSALESTWMKIYSLIEFWLEAEIKRTTQRHGDPPKCTHIFIANLQNYNDTDQYRLIDQLSTCTEECVVREQNMWNLKNSRFCILCDKRKHSEAHLMDSSKK